MYCTLLNQHPDRHLAYRIVVSPVLSTGGCKGSLYHAHSTTVGPHLYGAVSSRNGNCVVNALYFYSACPAPRWTCELYSITRTVHGGGLSIFADVARVRVHQHAPSTVLPIDDIDTVLWAGLIFWFHPALFASPKKSQPMRSTEDPSS